MHQTKKKLIHSERPWIKAYFISARYLYVPRANAILKSQSICCFWLGHRIDSPLCWFVGCALSPCWVWAFLLQCWKKQAKESRIGTPCPEWIIDPVTGCEEGEGESLIWIWPFWICRAPGSSRAASCWWFALPVIHGYLMCSSMSSCIQKQNNQNQNWLPGWEGEWRVCMRWVSPPRTPDGCEKTTLIRNKTKIVKGDKRFGGRGGHELT